MWGGDEIIRAQSPSGAQPAQPQLTVPPLYLLYLELLYLELPQSNTVQHYNYITVHKQYLCPALLHKYRQGNKALAYTS